MNTGEFSHSDPRLPDSLAEKQLRLLEVQRRVSGLQDKITEALDKRSESVEDELKEDIKNLKQKTKYMNGVIKDKRAKVNKMRELNQHLVCKFSLP